MPPSSPTPPLQKLTDTGRMLAPHKEKSSFGPTVGIVIILVLLGFGALYFWGASMNREQTPLPFIPDDNSTAPIE